MDDQRREVRYPARIAVRIHRRGETIELLTNDVSFRGAFMRTDTPPALRQLVRVAFSMPTGVIVSAHAMVVHSVRASGAAEQVPGVGVQFWGPIEEAKAWHEFVYALKMKERDGVPSARMTDKVRRISERFRLSLDVVVDGLTSSTRDLSENGMAVRTDSPMPVGMRTTMQLRKAGRAIISVGVIVRRRIQEAGFVGLGVEFVDVSEETHAAIVALVQDHAPPDDGAIFIPPDDPGLH